MRQRRAKIGTRRRAAPSWTEWAAEDILDLRLCDLGVRLEDTWVQPLVLGIQNELADRDIRLKPHFWLSDEWQSPDGVPGIGVPFYLAHRRLMAIERDQMLEVEGGSKAECLKLLRHEVGHAIQNGFALQRRRRWQRLFGRSSEPYPDAYRPDPGSRDYVQHLDGWYAQSHPAEDWAETFAVWMGTPQARWTREYAGWPALEKLQYVDSLMTELSGITPLVRDRRRPYSVAQLRKTLKLHYAEKRAHYGRGWSATYDAELRRVFCPAGRATPGSRSAAQFVRRHRTELRDLVSRATALHPLTVDYTLKEMIGRCDELGLRHAGHDKSARDAMLITLTARCVQLIYKKQSWRTV